MALNQLLYCQVGREALVGRRVQSVGEIRAHGSQRRAITDAESRSLNRIIEILNAGLVIAERNIAEVRVDVSHVVENDAAYIRAEERKSELEGIEEKRIASDGKTRR